MKIKNVVARATGAIATGVGYLTLAAGSVSAQGFIPDWLDAIVEPFRDTGTASEFVNARIRLALLILFVVVIIIAIAYSALAGIKFISSSGDSGKMEEAKSAVKAIMFGFAAMILSVAGIFLVFLLLGGQSGDLDTVIDEGIQLEPT